MPLPAMPLSFSFSPFLCHCRHATPVPKRHVQSLLFLPVVPVLSSHAYRGVGGRKDTMLHQQSPCPPLLHAHRNQPYRYRDRGSMQGHVFGSRRGRGKGLAVCSGGEGSKAEMGAPTHAVCLPFMHMPPCPQACKAVAHTTDGERIRRRRGQQWGWGRQAGVGEGRRKAQAKGRLRLLLHTTGRSLCANAEHKEAVWESLLLVSPCLIPVSVPVSCQSPGKANSTCLSAMPVLSSPPGMVKVM